MNMQFRFKVSGILIIFALLLASTPTSVVYSQTGGGYTCGSFQRLNAGTRGFPAFVPAGSENNQSAWWVIDTLDGNLLVTSTGEEIDPIANYGRSIWIWYPSFSSSGMSLESIGSYQWVSNCSPVVNATNTPLPTVVPLSINFWADSTTIMAGQCTNLHWSVTGSGITGVYIGNQAFPPISNANICLSSSATYTLLVYSSQGNQSSVVTINVLYPTNTPIPPTLTPIPPSATQIPPSATPIPPASLPTTPPYDGPLPNDGYEPSLSLQDKIVQFFVPPVQANSPTDCQARFTVNNCTWFVAGKRPDVCQWIQPGQGNAYQWASQAQQYEQNGGSLGITVNTTPKAGDIAVWSQDCGGTPKGQCSGPVWACGHVAYVTWASSDGKTMKIQEMNWSVDRTNTTIDVLSCMSFISSPSQIISSNVALTPTVIPIPIPSIIPTPSGQPSNLFQWIINLFNH
jgi:surface antigen